MGYYLYAPCATYNTAQMSTANQSIPNNPTGNGTLAPVAVTGLTAETLYCTQACVVDLDADPANGDPTGPVCGAVETFIWPTPVSAGVYVDRLCYESFWYRPTHCRWIR